MYNFTSKLVLALSLAIGVTAQITQTATPNAAEYAQIKSDIASYHSALTTQSLYIAAESYLQQHSTTVPPIGLRLQTDDWSDGISSLNALVTTTFAPDFPTLVASLYHSALGMQANIINNDIEDGGSSAMATGTGGANSAANSSSLMSMPTPTGSATTTGASTTASAGAANSQMIVNSAMIVAGFGVALLL